MFATPVFAQGMTFVLRISVTVGQGRRLACTNLGQPEFEASKDVTNHDAE